MKNRKSNFEDRMVQFAGDTALFCKSLSKQHSDTYYADQILRSSGSAALHYGEAQGTNTLKDFIHKMANVSKELKETRVGFKILIYLQSGNLNSSQNLLQEVNELILITAKMILNAKAKSRPTKNTG